MKKLLGCLLLTLHASLALSQVKVASADNWQTVFFESPTVALPLLTAAAIKHSAPLKSLEVGKAINQQDIQLAKKGILGNVSLGAGYTYGNQGSIGPADPSNPIVFNTYSAGRYSTGINVGLSLGQLVSRGNQIKREELNYQRTEFQRQEQENQIRQQVIPLYQNVLLARKLLNLQQEAYVTVQSNYRLTEKQFRQGQLSLAELSGATGQVTGAAIAQETARSQYDTAFMLLEEVVGAKISSLMTTQ